MHDFDFDCKEKKRIAQNAKRMKNGSKSRKCSLSTDHMTEAQWKKKNGEVITMNMNQPVTYEQFRAMSVDLQKEYVEKLISQFGCNLTALAGFFGLDAKGISKLCDELHIDRSRFGRGVRMSKEQIAAFNAWRDAAIKKLAETPAVKEIKKVEKPTPKVIETKGTHIAITMEPRTETHPVSKKQDNMRMSQVAASFAGHLNMEQIQKFLNYATDGKPAYITITVGELRDNG